MKIVDVQLDIADAADDGDENVPNQANRRYHKRYRRSMVICIRLRDECLCSRGPRWHALLQSPDIYEAAQHCEEVASGYRFI